MVETNTGYEGEKDIDTLTFTIGWLKLVQTCFFISGSSNFNFHHRVVETIDIYNSLSERNNFNFHHRVVETYGIN